MRFGSISYLNLLPFQVFLKRYISRNSTKMFLNYKKDVPSKINHALEKRQIDAGFISSVHSKKFNCTNLGIIANKRVYSVLLLKGKKQIDPASATSNQLANVLNLSGKVLIGDKALKYYLEGKEGIDLAYEWHKKTKLPFVFARLCYTKNGVYFNKLAKKFAKQKIKVPQYLLKKEAKKRGITPKELSWYLEHIHYKMNHQSKKSLKLFLKEVKNI